MDYMDIDEDYIFNLMDSVRKDSRERKIADNGTNAVHYREENTIIDSSEQNAHNKASGNLDSKAILVLDRGKEIVCRSNSESIKAISERRIIRRRRLVRNGCISPCNVAKAKLSAEKSDLNGFGPRDFFAEANDSYRILGKGVSNHSFSRKGPNSNLTSRNSNLGIQLGRSNGHCNAADTFHKIQNPAADSINHGVRVIETTNEGDNLTPNIINVGSHDVGGSCSNDEKPDLTAIQVETDEIFARQLQEQLYNEVPASGAAERGLSSSLHNQSVRRDVKEGRVLSFGRGTAQRPLPWQNNMTSSSSSTSRRHSLFPSNIDVDTRIHILEGSIGGME